VQLTNILGAAVALLDEYFITTLLEKYTNYTKQKRVTGMICRKQIKGLIKDFCYS
jgi:hypothetical protein